MSQRTVPLRNGVKRLWLSLPMLSILAGCGDETQTGAAATPGNQPLRGFLDLPSGRREVSYEVLDGLAIHDGDIILGNAEEVAAQWQAARTGAVAPQPGARVPYGNQIPPGGSFGSRPWPNGVVKYKYEPGSFTKTQQLLIFSGMIGWMPTIKFQECTTTSPCSYYVYIQKKTLPNNGCGQSRIGKSPDPGITAYQSLFLNIGNSSCANDLTAVAVHELGHAIGLYHEHQREDRDRYVKIGSGAPIDYGADGNFGTGNDPVTKSPLISTGRYDFESVMHYKNGNLGKTITLADGRALPPFTGLGKSVNSTNPDGKTPSFGDLAAAASLIQNVDVTDVIDPNWYLYQNYTQGSFKDVMNNPPPQAASMALAGTHYTTSYLAVRSSSSTLQVRKYTVGSGWGIWREMPGLIISSGVGIGVNYQTGGFYAAAVSDDLQSVCVHDGSTWNCDLGGPWPWADGYSIDRLSAPAVGTSPFGDLWVVAPSRLQNNLPGPLMATVRFSDGSWTGWYPMLDDVSGTPSIVWTPWGMDVFFVGRSDGGVHDSMGLFPAGSKPGGVTLDAGLSVVSRHLGTDPTVDQTFDVFVRGYDNMIWSRSRRNGTWDTGWKNLGGPAYTVPAATTLHDDLGTMPMELFFGGPFGTFLANKTVYDPQGLNNVIWHKVVAP